MEALRGRVGDSRDERTTNAGIDGEKRRTGGVGGHGNGKEEEGLMYREGASVQMDKDAAMHKDARLKHVN